MTKYKQSIKKKLRKMTSRDVIISFSILAISFLPYIHDFKIFKGMKGFSGFSSLRIAIYLVAMFLVALSGWIFAFFKSKGSNYRFAILAPIFMLSFQLSVYLLDARKSSVNDFNFKVIVNIVVAALLIALYFYGKSRQNEE